MKDLLVYIAKGLVDNPAAVQVTEVDGERTTILELKVSQADLGKIIGKQGRIIQAVRTILSAAAAKSGKRISVEIIE